MKKNLLDALKEKDPEGAKKFDRPFTDNEDI